ncbi:hypothetical protein [Iningainema tapete]|uniref:Uncharacterized protein n=1 Tax=Iningainema tapete BLCC-T55 TaxID=2748662 RepID=A0A8J7CG60_9CYAN|nr:hypothetical protein [Iningainema tapete]MBD2775935.1 hypothetical protein [Iningainema tapete BLCC-T55]
MKSVICVWCNNNSHEFEQQIPLNFLGKRNHALGFSNQFEILFLDGFDRIDQQYKNSLEELGYSLHDCSKIFASLSNQYSALSRFGDYEKKCFLRWLVIEQYLSGEAIAHYDGDIVFNEDPSILQQKMHNKTFMLQGCPALICISDKDWFNQYQSQLEVFVNNIEEYSEQAWQEREEWELSQENKWAGSRFRRIISSDQDFFSHLIHTDRISQDNPQEIISNLQSYILWENPLYLHVYSPWNKNLPFRYKRINNIDFINEQQVAFWHMQGYFVKYLGKYLYLKNILKFLNMRLTNEMEVLGGDKGEYFSKLTRKIIDKFHKNYSRLEIYNFYFKEKSFDDVFNNQVWWQKGVFV